MSITVEDCLQLSVLREAEVVAGAKGLNNIVAHVSVLEWSNSLALKNGIFLGNEIVITCFHYAKDDVDAQCQVVRDLSAAGEVGMILYYVGIVLPDIDARLIRTADELGYPLICMPRNRFDYRYSEAITEIMEAVFKDQMKEKYYVKDMLERLAMLPERQRTIGNVLRMLSDRLYCSIILCDREFKLLDAATWPTTANLNLPEILNLYKNTVLSRPGVNNLEFTYDNEVMAARSQPIATDDGYSMNLIFLNLPEKKVLGDAIAQAAELIQLSSSIWNFDIRQEGHREMLKAFFYDEPIKLKRIANGLHIDIDRLQTMWVLKSKADSPTREALTLKNSRLLALLKHFFNEHHIHAIADHFEDNVVALIEPPYGETTMTSFLEEFMKTVQDESVRAFPVNCPGENAAGAFRKAYFEIQDNDGSAMTIYPSKRIINTHEIEFSGLCREIAEKGKEAIDEKLKVLRALGAQDDFAGKELVSTLEVFLLDAEANVEQTSKLLFLHKSTIKYRIKKIKELLGCDIAKLPEAYSLYVAVAVKRLIASL
ncbi:PucR family transcriptional regulator [Desulfitobacterium hafniense]|uniref:Uncharacterized protein n=5 Tax=root TaxID=1 RepID=Q24YJ3_DESHY|nr:PucR family transcriptional regulator [Desulfitobacterium hafniense]ACL20231.1 transcriptional regulator, PucR family [Desulfitobacterium hafniense DCB-2]EHL05807.1 purine catabolism regulatory protein-like family protein [Desulfitobacterium hafniense DP7]KTE90437.1 transcriptional regulator [Desulfitobacterium hafniense]MEA5021758.1 PucR family transcriptional regulator ligand-binding domain-containing protein [Desulfitobacterium hafniense]CDX01032.1 Purine catabolism regulatory protein-li